MHERDVDRVHLVFKTHLDLGYTARASEVAAGYFEQFIPRAIDLADELRRRQGPERFVWTTGSWLTHEYLRRAGPAARERMDVAVAAGDIAWHALPFTTHSELAGASLFAHGLSLARDLDCRYGRQTIAAKLTDVPGHTRGIVPVLAHAGVQFLHIGVNPASTPPDVPASFVWRTTDGAEVLVCYATGDYGGATHVPGCSDALIVEHTGDNHGPPSVEDVLAAFASARNRFPGADVVASTLDAFAAAVAPLKPSLPVVTDEIGDSWIHGIGSDPLVVARFRQLCRLRDEWIQNGVVQEADRSFQDFSMYLLLVAEHTWGLAQSRYLRDYDNYDAESFRGARTSPTYQRIEQSWRDHRAYVDSAVASLPPALQVRAQDHLAECVPARPGRLSGTGPTLEVGGIRIAIDPDAGSICELTATRTGHRWATPTQSLASLTYQTFSAADYERFWREYIRSSPESDGWAREDFTKPGIERAGATSKIWRPIVRHVSRDSTNGRILIESAFPPECTARFGAPELLTTEYTIRPDGVEITTQWFNKPACRLPEAAWISFTPATNSRAHWTLDKLGVPLSPGDVVAGGNTKLHAVGTGGSCIEPDGRLRIETVDAPLIAPGEPGLLRFGGAPPDMRGGIHVNLYNNVWGNNFPTWYDDDAKFRFRITVDS